MKPFSIAAIQISLEHTDNFNLIERKTREVVARFPWIEMVVLSELAVGGANKSKQLFACGILAKIEGHFKGA